MDIEKIALEDYPVPIRYLIDVNWDCTLKCRMCVKRSIKRPYGQKSLDYLVDIVERLPWSREISIGCLGDAFSYKDLPEAMAYLKAKKLIAPLTTNGVNMTIEATEVLDEYTPLYVSIDSGDDKKYAEIRGKDELPKVIHNLTTLLKNRPNVPVSINCLLFSDNVDTIENIMRLISGTRIQLILFYPIHFYRELEERTNFWRLSRKERINALYTLASLAKVYNVKTIIPSADMRERQCTRAMYQPMIAYDGSVYPCDFIYQQMNKSKRPTWMCYNYKEPVSVPQYLYRMGNILEEDFISMWNSDRWRQLRSLISVLNTQGTGRPYDELFNETDIKTGFEFCKICPVRWSFCL